MFVEQLLARGVGWERHFKPLRHVGVFERLRAVEDAREGVIIPGRDRIELVIVAAGAADRLGEERAAQGVELLVHHVHLELLFILFFEVGVSQRQKSAAGELAAAFLDRGSR